MTLYQCDRVCALLWFTCLLSIPSHARVIVHPINDTINVIPTPNPTPNSNSFPNSSASLSFLSPAFPYLSSTTASFNVTSRVIRLSVSSCQDLEHVDLTGQIVWIINFVEVMCFLESLIKRCINQGCVGMIITDTTYTLYSGSFDFVDGSAYLTHGEGLTIPVVSIASRDGDMLHSWMNQGPVQVTIQDDQDENFIRQQILNPAWQAWNIIQMIMGSLLFILIGYRLWQWYGHYRLTGLTSKVAIISLLLEWLASIIRVAVPQAIDCKLGMYPFFTVQSFGILAYAFTALVDVLIICYFASTLYQANGHAMNDTSTLLIYKYRLVFSVLVVLILVFVVLSLILCSALVLPRNVILPALRMFYVIVLIFCIVLLGIMSYRVLKRLKEVSHLMQKNHRLQHQQQIKRITNRVGLSIIGMVFSLITCLGFFIEFSFTPDVPFRVEQVWQILICVGVHLSCLAHTETFHCPSPSQPVVPHTSGSDDAVAIRPAAKRDAVVTTSKLSKSSGDRSLLYKPTQDTNIVSTTTTPAAELEMTSSGGTDFHQQPIGDRGRFQTISPHVHSATPTLVHVHPVPVLDLDSTSGGDMTPILLHAGGESTSHIICSCPSTPELQSTQLVNQSAP